MIKTTSLPIIFFILEYEHSLSTCLQSCGRHILQHRRYILCIPMTPTAPAGNPSSCVALRLLVGIAHLVRSALIRAREDRLQISCWYAGWMRAWGNQDISGRVQRIQGRLCSRLLGLRETCLQGGGHITPTTYTRLCDHGGRALLTWWLLRC